MRDGAAARRRCRSTPPVTAWPRVNETVILTGSAPGLSDDTATLTITDDDPAPTAVSLSLDPSSVGESSSATDVTVTALLNNSPLPTPTTVTVSRTGGTATPGTDYPAITNFTLIIPAGRSSGTTTLSFDPTGDNLAEGNETVTTHRQRRVVCQMAPRP